MKKIVSIITMLATLLILCACSPTEKVKSVHVDSSEYLTIYVYSFKDATIDSKFESSSSIATPTSKGYIYSTEKLAIGDTIKVWNNFKFGEKNPSSWTDTREYGANAIVDKIVNTYRITVKSGTDSYVITYFKPESSYYNLSNSSVSNIEDLEKIVEHKIEVSKERVIIEYDLD
jgi:hypothetical protein